MTEVAKWQPGHLYLPGDLCVPRSGAQTNQTITNPGFESGDSDWTKDNVTIVNEAGSYSGSWHAKMVYSTGDTGSVAMASPLTIAPGQTVTATCMMNASGGGNQTGGTVRLWWLDSGNNLLSQSTGNQIDTTNGSGWRQSSVTATAPSGAVKFKVQGEAFIGLSGGVMLFDAFTLSVVGGNTGAGLIFEATQTDPGTSAGTEPDWPTTTGVAVTDGTVTWEGVGNSYVTWTAAPTMESGATEPTWPTTPGQFVSDGSVSWECITRRIEDENCPNTKVVVILASKVFAADEDIVRFSATANPLDWTSEQDAGYLPTGLQQANANDMAVLNQYRGNLVAFNASSFQNWQADPDPAAMAILDQMDGIGSTWQHAAQPVANELLYLSQRGVRSVGIAAGAENLSAGDVGEPIDVLVQDSLRVAAANTTKVASTYYPGAGQYWLAFSHYPVAEFAITGDVPDGGLDIAMVPYSYTSTGGVAPYGDYSILSGALPPGWTLSADGEVTGTATATGTYSWVVARSDADGQATLADSARIGTLWSPATACITNGFWLQADADANTLSKDTDSDHYYFWTDSCNTYEFSTVAYNGGEIDYHDYGPNTGSINGIRAAHFNSADTNSTGLEMRISDPNESTIKNIASGRVCMFIAAIWRNDSNGTTPADRRVVYWSGESGNGNNARVALQAFSSGNTNGVTAKARQDFLDSWGTSNDDTSHAGEVVIGVMVANWATGAVDLYVNGTLADTSTMPNFAGTSDAAEPLKFFIGSQDGGSVTGLADIHLGELIAQGLSAAISDEDRQLYEGYYAWQWRGDSSDTNTLDLLPADHPYKVSPPLVFA